jgi:effector-binding domain-containing protein
MDKNEPRLRTIEETPYLGHRFEVTGGVNDAVDRAFGEVFGWLGGAGVRAGEAPFIRFHELDAEGAPLTMEVGVVADAAPGPGDPLVPATLPAGRFITYLHHGAYRSESEPDLAAARARVEGWAADRGLELDRRATDRGRALGCYLERYLVGPNEEPDHSRWRTELAYLVAWP